MYNIGLPGSGYNIYIALSAPDKSYSSYSHPEYSSFRTFPIQKIHIPNISQSKQLHKHFMLSVWTQRRKTRATVKNRQSEFSSLSDKFTRFRVWRWTHLHNNNSVGCYSMVNARTKCMHYMSRNRIRIKWCIHHLTRC